MVDMVNRILQRGELYEKDFEDCGVPIDRSKKSKDHLVINRRRSILLTNEEFIAREEQLT